MLITSAAFATAITTSHRIATAAEVWSGVSASGPGTLLGTFTPTAGLVKVDIANATRRSCDVTLVDPNYVPSTGALITPYGNELRLYRGVTYPNGARELMPLGVFAIASADVTDTPQGISIKVLGFDRADKVARALLTDTYSIAAGTNTAVAIQALITSRVGGLTFSFAPTTAVLPSTTLVVGDNPWAKALELAKSIGADLFFDAYGVCTLTPVTDPATAPVSATLAEGATSTLVDLARSITNRETFSDVIAIGQGSGVGDPIRAQVTDINPQSPTYINGPYGDVVTIYRSPLLTSAAMATAAAQAVLFRGTGLAEQITMRTLVNPALDVGDVVVVTRARAKVINARYTIDALDIPLGADATQSIIGRRRTS